METRFTTYSTTVRLYCKHIYLKFCGSSRQPPVYVNIIMLLLRSFSALPCTRDIYTFREFSHVCRFARRVHSRIYIYLSNTSTTIVRFDRFLHLYCTPVAKENNNTSYRNIPLFSCEFYFCVYPFYKL